MGDTESPGSLEGGEIGAAASSTIYRLSPVDARLG